MDFNMFLYGVGAAFVGSMVSSAIGTIRGDAAEHRRRQCENLADALRALVSQCPAAPGTELRRVADNARTALARWYGNK